MLQARSALIFSALAAACSSPTPEPQPAQPPELVVSGSCSGDEDTPTLAIAVANRGLGAAAPATARIEFEGDPASGIMRRTRFIAAHAVDTFEVELPAVCSKIACRWHVTIESAKQVQGSGYC